MNDEHFMRLALKEAEGALANRNLPVGAIVTLDGRVIGTGRRSAMSLGKLDHGEMLAIRQAYQAYPKDFGRMVVYATLEPCLMCFGTILNSRMPRIVYAFQDDFSGATRIPVEYLPTMYSWNGFEIVRNVCRAESKELLRRFFETTDQEFWKNCDNPLVAAVFAKN